MRDGLSPQDGTNRAHIDVGREDDLHYWCDHLDLSENELKDAVFAVGNRVEDVRKYLQARQTPTWRGGA
jgi:hypothetical protein